MISLSFLFVFELLLEELLEELPNSSGILDLFLPEKNSLFKFSYTSRCFFDMGPRVETTVRDAVSLRARGALILGYLIRFFGVCVTDKGLFSE